VKASDPDTTILLQPIAPNRDRSYGFLHTMTCLSCNRKRRVNRRKLCRSCYKKHCNQKELDLFPVVLEKNNKDILILRNQLMDIRNENGTVQLYEWPNTLVKKVVCPCCDQQVSKLVRGICSNCYQKHYIQGTLEQACKKGTDEKPVHKYIVYSLRFLDHTVYYGITFDLRKRILEHFSDAEKSLAQKNKGVTKRLNARKLHHIRIHRIVDTIEEAHALELLFCEDQRRVSDWAILNAVNSPSSYSKSKSTVHNRRLAENRCRICGTYQPNSEFTRSRHRHNGLNNKCKTCVRYWGRLALFIKKNDINMTGVWNVYRRHYNLNPLEFFSLPEFKDWPIYKAIQDSTFVPTTHAPNPHVKKKVPVCQSCGCVNPPRMTRGLCQSCYSRHHTAGTLDQFQTRRTRVKALREAPIPEGKHKCLNCYEHIDSKRLIKKVYANEQVKYICKSCDRRLKKYKAMRIAKLDKNDATVRIHGGNRRHLNHNQ